MRKTERGFSRMEFKDCGRMNCSIQKSSAALEDRIWLGINQDEVSAPLHFIPNGNPSWRKVELPPETLIHGRMELNREQVALLLPYLIKFVETGELE